MVSLPRKVRAPYFSSPFLCRARQVSAKSLSASCSSSAKTADISLSLGTIDLRHIGSEYAEHAGQVDEDVDRLFFDGCLLLLHRVRSTMDLLGLVDELASLASQAADLVEQVFCDGGEPVLRVLVALGDDLLKRHALEPGPVDVRREGLHEASAEIRIPELRLDRVVVAEAVGSLLDLGRVDILGLVFHHLPIARRNSSLAV